MDPISVHWTWYQNTYYLQIVQGTNRSPIYQASNADLLVATYNLTRDRSAFPELQFDDVFHKSSNRIKLYKN
jgi:hypothetical protein